MTQRILVAALLSTQAALSVLAASDSTLNVLVYETDQALSTTNNILNTEVAGFKAQIVGRGQKFTGFGSKYEAVLPALQQLDATSVTVISDGRDVLLNHAAHHGSDSVAGFLSTFEKLTGSTTEGAVVISAEAQCCVSALTHFAPGELFSPDGKRAGQACYSGKDDCLWQGDDKAKPWESFMKDVAVESGAADREDIYLNAGLMVGRASDLIRVIEAAAIGEQEDDQAVLTDYMFSNPGKIILDYDQSMFGNNRETCMFELQDNHLVHKQMRTTPLFIHTPGGSSTCHVELMAQLGQKKMSKTTKRRLSLWKGATHNYYEANTCKSGYKKLGADCVRNWCFKDFQCPSGSSRIPGQDCYDSRRDCQCDDKNQVMAWNGCRAKRTSYFKSNNRQKNKRSNFRSSN